jgi:ferrochelatase
MHHPLLIEADARHARAALDTLPPPLRAAARFVFTAHSIPIAMTVPRIIACSSWASSRLVAERLGAADCTLVFQSRSGRPEDPWLEPDVCQYLRAERAHGLAAAVICPVGFVCDHVEVLYDLDTEAAQVCRGERRPAVHRDDGRRSREGLGSLSDGQAVGPLGGSTGYHTNVNVLNR